jgi:hypothetical protein
MNFGLGREGEKSRIDETYELPSLVPTKNTKTAACVAVATEVSVFDAWNTRESMSANKTTDTETVTKLFTNVL